MTAKARQLGMTSTTFRNASGLHHRDQVTTARDLARLARALQRDFPKYYKYFSLKEFDFQGQTIHPQL
jgi:D-alanyl-D-alanine carboxypeptidase